MKRFVWLTLWLFCFCTLSVWAADYRFERNIPYRSASLNAYADSMCRLDVACPKGVSDAPVIVWFHGGGCIQKFYSERGLVVAERFCPGLLPQTNLDK